MSVILLTASFFARQRVSRIQKSIDEARGQLSSLSESYASASELQSGLSVIQGILDNETQFADFFSELEDAVRTQSRLTSIDIQTTEAEPGQAAADLEEQKGVFVNAQSTSSSEIIALIKRFENMQRVDFIDVQYVNVTKDENNRTLYEANIMFGLNQRPGEPLEAEGATE